MGCIIAGKTKWLKRLIQYRETVFSEKFQHIIYCFGETSGDMHETHPDVELFKGLPSEDQLGSWIAMYKHQPWLLILDDLSTNFHNSSMGGDICTRLSHHYNCSLVNLSHTIFQSGSSSGRSRIVSLNMHHFLLLPTNRDLSTISHFGRQVMGNGFGNAFVDCFLDATERRDDSKRPTYLLVTLHPLYSNRQCLLFSKILPDEAPMIAYKKMTAQTMWSSNPPSPCSLPRSHPPAKLWNNVTFIHSHSRNKPWLKHPHQRIGCMNFARASLI